jgi:2-phosphosulfolactate phosphatase
MNGILQLARSDVLIIVDVLSFTTSVDVALGRGATVLPYRWRDDSANKYARERNAELAGSRDQPESKYSLSPSSLEDAHVGLRLVLPSPNGSSLAFAAKASGKIVLAGCLRNASAVAAWAQQAGRQISVIPAGERWPDGSLRPALEDLIGAGAILKALPGSPSPEVQLAVAAYDHCAPNLLDRLLACSSGRELAERGFSRDADLAAEVDISPVVPILEGETFVPAASSL